jgi:hypothetical protein
MVIVYIEPSATPGTTLSRREGEGVVSTGGKGVKWGGGVWRYPLSAGAMSKE